LPFTGASPWADGCTGELSFAHLEHERDFARSVLAFKSGFPLAGDVRAERRQGGK
jgi:hypothetical protein